MLMAAAISASADASKDGQATADETPGLVKSIYVLRCCSRRSESEGNQGIKPRYEKDDGTRPYPFARERERVSQTLLMPRGRKERERERAFFPDACMFPVGPHHALPGTWLSTAGDPANKAFCLHGHPQQSGAH